MSRREAGSHTAHRRRGARYHDVVAGCLGAAAVAVFYLAIDLSRGVPFMTPSVLGEVLLLHKPITATPDAVAVVLYTLVHGVLFVAFGALLGAVMRAAATSSLARYALVQLLVVFEVFFYGAWMIASEEAGGRFPFVGVLAANTIAAGLMVTWQWRAHPRLRAAFRREPLGAGEQAHSTLPVGASRRAR